MRTPGWDLAHAYNSTLEGWLVLVARRHIAAVADLTDDEAAELGPLLKRVSAALHQTTGSEKTYVMQFAESPDHPHVHIHVVARRADHPHEARGPGVFCLLGGDPSAHVGEERMTALALRLRVALDV